MKNPSFERMSFKIYLVDHLSALYRGKRGRPYHERVVEFARELDDRGELTTKDVVGSLVGGTRLYSREILGTFLATSLLFFAFAIHGFPRQSAQVMQASVSEYVSQTPVVYWTFSNVRSGCRVTDGPSKTFLTLVDGSGLRKSFQMAGTCSPLSHS